MFPDLLPTFLELAVLRNGLKPNEKIALPWLHLSDAVADLCRLPALPNVHTTASRDRRDARTVLLLAGGRRS